MTRLRATKRLWVIGWGTMAKSALELLLAENRAARPSLVPEPPLSRRLLHRMPAPVHSVPWLQHQRFFLLGDLYGFFQFSYCRGGPALRQQKSAVIIMAQAKIRRNIQCTTVISLGVLSFIQMFKQQGKVVCSKGIFGFKFNYLAKLIGGEGVFISQSQQITKFKVQRRGLGIFRNTPL